MDNTTFPPPYVPFPTFQSALDYLQENGVPGKVDRSALPTYSGISQGQLLGTFRFLGLIDGEFTPQPLDQPTLKLLADSGKRKAILAELLKSKYPDVFAIGLESASPSQFNSATSSLKATGTTLEKARTFFLKAAEFAGITISPHLTRRKPRRAKKSVESSRRSPQPDTIPNPQPEESSGGNGGSPHQYEKTVRLPDAKGTVTLSGTFNPFELIGRERDLVNKIVDDLMAFENEMERAGD